MIMTKAETGRNEINGHYNNLFSIMPLLYFTLLCIDSIPYGKKLLKANDYIIKMEIHFMYL